MHGNENFLHSNLYLMERFYLFVLFSTLRQQLLLPLLHRQMVKDLGIVQWITQKGHPQDKDRYFPTV